MEHKKHIILFSLLFYHLYLYQLHKYIDFLLVHRQELPVFLHLQVDQLMLEVIQQQQLQHELIDKVLIDYIHFFHHSLIIQFFFKFALHLQI